MIEPSDSSKCKQCKIYNACWVNGTKSKQCVKCRKYSKHKFDDMVYRIREDIIDENPADMWPEEEL